MSTISDRIFVGSPYERGVKEDFPFRIDVSVWKTGTYDAPAVRIYDADDNDVTSTVLSGTASFSGSYLITPDFVADGMTAGEYYLIEFDWTVDGKLWGAYGTIKATRQGA